MIILIFFWQGHFYLWKTLTKDFKKLNQNSNNNCSSRLKGRFYAVKKKTAIISSSTHKNMLVLTNINFE